MKTVLRLVFGSVLVFLSQSAAAAIERGGVLNEVSDRFLNASSSWSGTISGHATWLFWTLVVISMVWTFGMMALRKADIGEFFAEFVRFTVFTGFFWWLLMNGPSFAMDIINSLRTIGSEASGLGRGLNPSTPIDIAFDIIGKAAKSYSVTSPIDNLSIFLTTLAILACMAVVAANVLLALVTAWVLAYAGVFVLGFGGARWTSDIALNYFRSVAGIALKLMTMTLLVGIAVSIIDGYHTSLAAKASMDELLVIFVVSLVLVILVNTIPNVMAGLIPGGGAAASAGSSFGAGAVMGAGMAAAGMAMGGVAMAGKAAMGVVTSSAGGASAIKAAFEKAGAAAAESGSGSSGSGAMVSIETVGAGSGASENVSPFAEAAGFNGSSGDSGGSGGGSASTQPDQGADTMKGQQAAGSSDSMKESGKSGSGDGGGFGHAAKMAVGTASELAKGIGGQVSEGFKERVADTAGGKLAASIRASIDEPVEAETSHEFSGNSISGVSDEYSDEVAAFVNKKD
ncbi:conjugal transfer protein TrbL [Thiopseudomonas alkaliphila]|uniref:P-type conjugative transfer protein TrbL n=1 Tax=Thiopseudomonas alkaliphila TaxID=1697053 RepID=UPI00069E4C52|nr:P-type conjugative transfer protein TrbL [Thiopseudomonas alkaliphila]AKX44640.1 conjugal transfer protein TrbL [Thiopseudomonas alkaliphila]